MNYLVLCDKYICSFIYITCLPIQFRLSQIYCPNIPTNFSLMSLKSLFFFFLCLSRICLKSDYTTTMSWMGKWWLTMHSQHLLSWVMTVYIQDSPRSLPLCVKSVIALLGEAQVSRSYDTVIRIHPLQLTLLFYFRFHCTCSECTQICQHGADSAPFSDATPSPHVLFILSRSVSTSNVHVLWYYSTVSTDLSHFCLNFLLMVLIATWTWLAGVRVCPDGDRCDL